MLACNVSPPLDHRRSGILLHPTSLPGPYPNGVLGRDLYRFIDLLVSCGFSVWQTLPLGPTHGDGSPYQSLSVHAGNPLLIDLDDLVHRGWMSKDRLQDFFSGRIGRETCTREVAFLVRDESDLHLSEQFSLFKKENNYWLADFALYCALKRKFGGKGWLDWPDEYKNRDAAALKKAMLDLHDDIFVYEFEQFIFFSQWNAVKDYAHSKGVYIFGDLPIFVAHDSADVWANRECFKLDESGRSIVVAGVPPDYFSATGQRWGNPHYNWKELEKTGFKWWIDRIRSQQVLFDLIRIDHFRGFEACWEIPASDDTAINGRWVKAPGEKLLKVLFSVYPDLAMVAEDLGIITPEVEALRDEFNLPGMKILQFAFSGEATNPYLPHNHEINSVVYTGTHDNDTTLSWLETLNDHDKAYIQQYFHNPYEHLHQVMMSTAMSSVAKLAILPFQDLLGLGRGHRMNTPGTSEGNWSWRFDWSMVHSGLKAQSCTMNKLYGRSK